MPESLTADQRVKLMIGEMQVQIICLSKEVEDLRAKLAASAPAEPAQPAPAPTE